MAHVPSTNGEAPMATSSARPERIHLWYTSPARIWPHALPIGNGRLGAMVWGQVQRERWQLNEDSVWYGGPRNATKNGQSQDRNPRDALANLPLLRRLVDEGRLAEAEALVERAFVGVPQSQRHYESAGQADIVFPNSHAERDVAPGSYRRWLDLETATAGVKYEVGGVRFERETFASHAEGCIVGQIQASKPGMLTFDLRLNRQSDMPPFDRGEGAKPLAPEDVDTNVYMDSVTALKRDGEDPVLVLHAQTGGGGVALCIVATVHAQGGNVKVLGETIVVENADSATVVLTAETTFRRENPEAVCLQTLSRVGKTPYAELRREHVQGYQAMFGRSDLRLGSLESRLGAQAKPTNELLDHVRGGEEPHPWLVNLYYLFGRYLLVSSSLPSKDGTTALPANLQGIWCGRMAPAWGSKFTININTEMNYWPACSTGLAECELPLFQLLERLAQNGYTTARVMYGCEGWCAHHNTDIWGDSAPQDRWLPATLWPLGGAWLCTHIWQYFEYTGDLALLRRMYPVLKGCVDFFLDFLVDRDGFKVTNPSLSPENRYRMPSGEEGAICFAPAIDGQILHQLFSDFLASAGTLGMLKNEDTAKLARRVKEFQDKLPPLRIGQHGQIQEWWEDYEETELGHRHVSHLWGLYPGSQITPHSPAANSNGAAPTLFAEACRVTLSRRLSSGGGHTGWSRAWMIALYARLGDGKAAGFHVREILRTSTYDSLLDDHPPFQIDGGFGAVAGMAEMLVQCWGGTVWLLPALPAAWVREGGGSVKGLCAKGGFVFDLQWDEHGLLTAGKMRSTRGGECVLNSKQAVRVLAEGEGGQVVAQSKTPGLSVTVETDKSASYSLSFY